MDLQTLLFNVKGGVAEITINRPDANNSLDLACAKELMDAAILCDTDPEIRAVIITGSKNAFCPGGDLKSFYTHVDRLTRHLKEVTTYLHAAISRFARGDAPVITAISGVAAGAGFSLACAGDIIIAGESARFTSAYTGVGLSPDGALTYFLPRMVGVKRALELTLTNPVLSAKMAMEWGIVARVVTDADVLSEARALANKLASGPTKAFGATRRLLDSGCTETLETQMEMESRALACAAGTNDAQAGIVAFIERRKPEFTGD